MCSSSARDGQAVPRGIRPAGACVRKFFSRSLSGIRNHNLDLVVRAALSSDKIGSWNPVISLVAFGSSPGHFSQPRQGFSFLVPYDICQARAERNSLSKLWVRQIQVAKRYILVGLRLDLARAVVPDAVAVEQHPHHHCRVKGGLPPPVLF